MPILCKRCGKMLLRDDSRFCNNCGAPVSSQDVIPSTLSESVAEPTMKAEEQSKPVLREQIAQQPPSRSARYTSAQEPPAWMSQLDKQDARVRRRPRLVRANRAGDVPQSPAAYSVPAEERIQPSEISPVRELRVKVWDQEEMVPPEEHEADATAQEHTIEELPTSPLGIPSSLALTTPEKTMASPEELPTGPLIVPSSSAETVAPLSEQERLRDEFEQVDTVSMPSSLATKSPAPVAEAPKMQPSASHVSGQAPVWQHMMQSPPLPVQEHPLRPAAQLSAAPRRKKRGVLAFLVILLCLLIAAALGSWIWMLQPFSVSPVTQPYQNYKGTYLSLLYPNDWTVQTDKAKTTVSFYDSTKTAQFTIVVADAAGNAINVKQQATKLGLTELKSGAPTTLTFAGASWQQIQGVVQQQGATYSGTMLMTAHGGHLFTLLQLAPQSIYTEEDKINFSAIRSSFQFLG